MVEAAGFVAVPEEVGGDAEAGEAYIRLAGPVGSLPVRELTRGSGSSHTDGQSRSWQDWGDDDNGEDNGNGDFLDRLVQ